MKRIYRVVEFKELGKFKIQYSDDNGNIWEFEQTDEYFSVDGVYDSRETAELIIKEVRMYTPPVLNRGMDFKVVSGPFMEPSDIVTVFDKIPEDINK